MRTAAKKLIFLAFASFFTAVLSGCGGSTAKPPADGAPASDETAEVKNSAEAPEPEGSRMRLVINGLEVSVEWEENESVDALKALASDGALTLDMSMYGGFEQVGDIVRELPRNDTQTTARAGDIMLYSGSKLVVFYGENSWAYTRLGRIVGLNSDELTKLLGGGNVTITIVRG